MPFAAPRRRGRRAAVLAGTALLLAVAAAGSATRVDAGTGEPGPGTVAANTMWVAEDAGGVQPDPQASDGVALVLIKSAAAGRTVELRRAATVTVRARTVVACPEAPTVMVAVDHDTVLTTRVTAPTWSSYRATVAVAAGWHRLVVGLSLASGPVCPVALDTITFAGAAPVPSQPTPTPPAGPSTPTPTAGPSTPTPSATSAPPQAAGTPGAARPPAGVLFDADLAHRGLAAYGSVVNRPDIALVADPVLGPTRTVMRVTGRDDQTGGLTDDPRVQAETPAVFGEGADLYAGFAVLFPPGWPDQLPGTGWVSLAEFHGPPFDGPSPWSVGMTGGKPGLSAMTHPPETPWQDAWATGPVARNRWYDVVVHEVLSRDAAKGYVEMWLNAGGGWVGQQIHGVARYPMATMDAGSGATGPMYHKVALYRARGMYAAMTVYFADHKVATSFAAAAPHSYG